MNIPMHLFHASSKSLDLLPPMHYTFEDENTAGLRIIHMMDNNRGTVEIRIGRILGVIAPQESDLDEINNENMHVHTRIVIELYTEAGEPYGKHITPTIGRFTDSNGKVIEQISYVESYTTDDCCHRSDG